MSVTESCYAHVKRQFIAEMFGIDVPVMSKLTESMDAESARCVESAELLQSPMELDERIREARQTSTLGAYIRAKAHRLNRVTYRPALFEQGQITRDYWSRLLNDELRASKEKLLRVAILLELSRDEAEEMLEKGGYALSPADLRDVVIAYCLQNGHYDFVLIERLLADYDIQSLFNDRRGA